MNRYLLTGAVILACICIIISIAYACVSLNIDAYYKECVKPGNTVYLHAWVYEGGPVSGWNWIWPSGFNITYADSDETDSYRQAYCNTVGLYEIGVEATGPNGYDSESTIVYVIDLEIENNPPNRDTPEYIAYQAGMNVYYKIEPDSGWTPDEVKLYIKDVSSGSTFRELTLSNGVGEQTAYWNGQNVRSQWAEPGQYTARIRIRESGTYLWTDYHTFEVVDVDVEMELEKVGDTEIESANTYSENTTIRVTAVDADYGQPCSWFTGTVNIAEDGTDIYSQHTDKGAYLPSSVEITSGGTTTFIAKSLADPIDYHTRPDPARIITTNYDVFNPSGYLSVEQWTNDLGEFHDKCSGWAYDWFETRTKDIFDNATGDLATVLSKMSGYVQCGHDHGGSVNLTHSATSLACLNPHWVAMRLDTDGGGQCVHTRLHYHTNSVIHEARHCYQDYLTTENLEQPDDIPWKPDNDDDQDWLVDYVPIWPNYFIIDSNGVRSKCEGYDMFSGDDTLDDYKSGGTRSQTNNVLERDASYYADQND